MSSKLFNASFAFPVRRVLRQEDLLIGARLVFEWINYQKFPKMTEIVKDHRKKAEFLVMVIEVGLSC